MAHFDDHLGQMQIISLSTCGQWPVDPGDLLLGIIQTSHMGIVIGHDSESLLTNQDNGMSKKNGTLLMSKKEFVNRFLFPGFDLRGEKVFTMLNSRHEQLINELFGLGSWKIPQKKKQPFNLENHPSLLGGSHEISNLSNTDSKLLT